MTNEVVKFAGVLLALPEGWADITADLPAGSPHTLAKADGVGALQFSPARYTAGRRPNIQPGDLRDLLSDFARTQGLGDPVRMAEGSGKTRSISADYAADGEFIRVWYVTNGTDVLLVTYVAEQSAAPCSLRSCLTPMPSSRRSRYQWKTRQPSIAAEER